MKTLVSITLILLLGMSACRSSEANYRAAYEKAKNHRESWDGIEGTVYEAIRREAVPSELLFDGVKIPAQKIRVKATADRPLGRRYLVVAQFKQLFNAESMCARLRDAGYTDATILETAEPLYYVAASQVDDDLSAVAEYLRFTDAPPMKIKEPFPWILITVK